MKVHRLAAIALAFALAGGLAWAAGNENEIFEGALFRSKNGFIVGNTTIIDADGEVTADITGDITGAVTGNVTGNLTGQVFGTTPATQTIAAGNTVTANACGGLKLITAAGAVTTSTTDTFTAPATANKGCWMFVLNVGANAITLDNNAKFTSPGAADVVLAQNEGIIVISDGSTTWYAAAAKVQDHA